ncbi:MAG: type II toxin-antitoxin system PemK/MazF family toxin [Prolixibacteraceae bacterium]|nr:type II toxin-antitoxin system PemK/MazF family toxin [Prolixibacteraceae bacterium]
MKFGLTKDSSADCFQIRSVSQERFVKKLGNLSEIIMDEMRIGLSKVLSIENE